MPSKMLLYIIYSLYCLIVYRGETGLHSQQEAVNPCCYDMEPVLQQFNKRQEYLVRYSQSRQKQKGRVLIISVNVEIHRLFNCVSILPNQIYALSAT